jgi:hypothetical protein
MKIWHYIKAAFNAKPIGMFVPPNWLGLALIFLLGLMEPGLLLLGLGLELAYLYTLSSSARFRRVVDGQESFQQRSAWDSRVKKLVLQLAPDDQLRYRNLEKRCQGIIAQQNLADNPIGMKAQAEGFGKFLWIYLRLLLTRQAIMRIQSDPLREGDRHTLEDRVAKLQTQLADKSIADELRKSLSSQAEILQQRLAKQAEARDKLAYLEAELVRVQEQVELIREQAALSGDPTAVSQRIDEVSASLGGTTQWISDQQQIYGKIDDMLDQPPPVAMPAQPQLGQKQ